MNETSKCYAIRESRGDFTKWLHGNGIDLGAGDDPLKIKSGTVRAWDLPDGDAQLVASIADNTYDFVYSSHCLEHMRDVTESLRNWLRITKPGGHVYIVVPEYILYEKMCWPSRFNLDHKQSFSVIITRQAVVRPNHFNIEQDLTPIIKSLGAQVVFMRLEDIGFNYNYAIADQTMTGALSQICIVMKKNNA